MKRKRTFTEGQKKIVAARQEWRCSSCDNMLPPSFEIDHTIPLCDGGADDYEHNATAMCGNCHSNKTQRERVARVEKQRADREKAAAKAVPLIPHIKTPRAPAPDNNPFKNPFAQFYFVRST